MGVYYGLICLEDRRPLKTRRTTTDEERSGLAYVYSARRPGAGYIAPDRSVALYRRIHNAGVQATRNRPTRGVAKLVTDGAGRQRGNQTESRGGNSDHQRSKSAHRQASDIDRATPEAVGRSEGQHGVIGADDQKRNAVDELQGRGGSRHDDRVIHDHDLHDVHTRVEAGLGKTALDRNTHRPLAAFSAVL